MEKVSQFIEIISIVISLGIFITLFSKFITDGVVRSDRQVEVRFTRFFKVKI